MRKICTTLLIFSTILNADDHSIAVLDFSGEGIHEEELKSLSAKFRIELLKVDTLRVLNYNDMRKTLSDVGYEDPYCLTLSCGVIVSMLLEQEWLAKAHITKVGNAYIVEAHLFDSETGRVINVVTYDKEISLEGLQTRGMHNVAELLLSTRIPLEVHQRQNLVYIKTKPRGAMVRVGREKLSGKTPMALNRVLVESRPIIIIKDGYQPFRVKQLPEDHSDILYVELEHSVPQIGHLAFAKPIPEGIIIVSSDGEDRFLVEENAISFNDLSAGTYHLESGNHIINRGHFRIRHRRTTQIEPQIYLISDIEKDRDQYKKKRNIVMGLLGASLGYRAYLSNESESIYKKYGSNLDQGDSRHKQIESMDKQKPIFDVISAGLLFPIIYYQVKYLQMNRWLLQ